MRTPHGTTTKCGERVSIRLINEVMDHAPAALTWRERFVLTVLAEDANDETRQCYPAYDGDDERSARFRARVRCSRSQYYEVIQALGAKGVLRTLRRGQKYGAARYLILPMAPAQRPGLQDPEHAPQGPGSQDAERSSQGPGLTDSGSRFGGVSVPVSGAQGPGLQDLYSSVPSIPSSLSTEVEFVRAANVVRADEERDFADWIIRTRRPGSPAWWRAVIGNGDIVVLAAAWRATAAPKQPAAPVLAECAECRVPIKGQPAPDGLCVDCRTAPPTADEAHQRVQDLLAGVPPKDLADALARARAEGLTGVRAQETRAVELLYASYAPDPEDVPDWPPPEVSP